MSPRTASRQSASSCAAHPPIAPITPVPSGGVMRRLFFVAVMSSVGGSSARADDHYLTVFTAESIPFRPEKAHTFVAVTRIAPDGVAETHSISWLAATTV